MLFPAGESGSADGDLNLVNVWWQFHKKNYGEDFDYQDFAPQFNAELFDAEHVILASGSTPGPLARMPIDGLQVGFDNAGAIGKYTAPNKFAGKIERVTITLGR